MKQIYLLKHKYVPNWVYVGATSNKYLSQSFAKKWCDRNKKWYRNVLLYKALRCTEESRTDWEITQLHSPSEDWESLEGKYIVEYNSYHNGLNSTVSGQFESTPAHKAASSRTGKLTGVITGGTTSSKPILCSNGISYKSAMDAERQTGINNASISSCCHGKRKHAGGFIWHFINKELTNG